MKFGNEVKCACCEEKFRVENKKTYKWQLDNEFFCSYKCYSKVFDSKYQASSISACSRLRYAKGRTIDKGYERHGSR